MEKKYKSIIVLFMTVISVLFLAGCDTAATNDPDGGTGSISSFIDGAKDSNGNTKHFLGKGYDVFSEYAKEDNVKEPLLDFDKMKAADILQGSAFEKSSINLVSGSSAEEYSKSYSATVGVSGSYRGFTASVSSTFGKDATSSSTKAFASVIGQYNKYMEKIYASSINASALAPYMTSNFNDAISNITKETSQDDIIKNLFKVYGTHIITGAYHGGFLSYSKSTSSSDVSSAKQFGLAVSAGYSSVTGDSFKTENSVDTSSAEAKAESSTNAIIDARGGDSVYATNLQSGLSTANFGKWLEGFSDSAKWVLCGFTSGDAGTGLYPITEFFTDAEVKKNVEDALKKYEEQCLNNLSSDAGTITYTATLTFDKDNIQCDAGDTGDGVPEFYGSISVNFKSDSKILWELTDKEDKKIPRNWGTWQTIEGGQEVSYETTNPADTMSFNMILKEDDDGGDDDFVLDKETDSKEVYSFNDLLAKIKDKDPYIVFKMKGDGTDKVWLRAGITVDIKTNE